MRNFNHYDRPTAADYPWTHGERVDLEGETRRVIPKGQTFGRLYLAVPDVSRDIVVIGDVVGLSEGLPTKVKGEYTVHPKWGPQIKIRSAADIQQEAPTTQDGALAYLRSLPHVGVRRGQKLLDAYGDVEAAFAALESGDAKARKAMGLGKETFSEVVAKFAAADDDDRAARVQLGDWGLTDAKVSKCCKHFSETSRNEAGMTPSRLVTRIENNPFVLMVVPGIGWTTCDQIRHALGYPKDWPPRVQTGLIEAFKQAAARNGDVWVAYPKLRRDAFRLLGISHVRVIEEHLDAHQTLVREMDETGEKIATLAALYRAECVVARIVAARCD